MSPEGIVFSNTSPVGIYNRSSFFFGTYAVFPVVGICKATTRPAEVRYFNLTEGKQNIISDTICIWYFGIGTYPQTSIDTVSQVF